MASLMPQAKQQYFDSNGNPLAGGKLYSYAAGTSTPMATYTTAAGTVANANPVVLNARGEASVFFSSLAYKLALHDADDVEIWTADNLQLNASGTLPNVRDIGATGDGVTDDTAALQAALDSGVWHFLPRGRYRITSTLTFTSGSGFIGESSFFWQHPANSPSINGASTIFYDGAAGANTCAVRMSRVAVGTLPVHQSDESETLRNACLKGVLIDGNNKAEYGLYSARAGLGNIYDQIVVTGTKKRGFWFGEFWTCRVGSLLAIHNYGSAGSFGENTFSWATGNIVNAIQVDLLQAFKNGRDAGYNESSAPLEGVGWILEWNRSCSANTLVGELNYGPGLYMAPRTGPNTIHGLYLEDNCHFDPAIDDASATNTAYALGKATQPWGMIGYNRESASGGDSVQIIFNEVFGASPGTPTRYQHIKLTGDTSGGLVVEPSEPWVFRSMYGIRTIDSRFYNYSVEYPQSALVDSSATADLETCLPAVGVSESLVGTATTLYVGNTATGNKSGRDASNRILLADALACARVCSGVVTLDVSAMTSTGATGAIIDGKGFSRRIAIEGGTTGRFNNSSGTAAVVKNWRPRIRIAGMAVLDRMYCTDASVEFDDNPIMRMGPDATAGAAVVCDNAKVEINGTSVLSLSASSAATKIGISLKSNSEVSFNNAAAGTIASYTAGHGIDFDEGSGIVRVSLTTATAAWAAAANVSRNTGGGAGVILAPNGLNP